ncbi:addiction module protein [Propionivibrio sp.]|uniref:addiction module protein n=1 Tax=Propionivibrio sp. TaxID=2212460 RepID=UPI003BF45B59
MPTIDIVELPTAEKLKLMESLWDSLCMAPVNDIHSPAWHAEVLTERMRRLDAGNERVSSWSEAKERIRNQVKSS